MSSAEAKFGAKSFAFDGDGDWMTVANRVDFNYVGPFTIELWWRYEGEGDQILMVKRAGETANNVRLHVNKASGLGWLVSKGGNWDVLLKQDGLPAPSEKTWHHLAMSWDGTTYRLFLNGAVVWTVADTAPPDVTDAPLTFGAGQGGGSPLHGYLDEIRISNVARYTSDFTPTGPFATDAHTKLLLHGEAVGAGGAYVSWGTGAGAAVYGGGEMASYNDEEGPAVPANTVLLLSMDDATFADSSGNGVTITKSGGAAFDTATKKVGAGALDLSAGGGASPGYLSAPKGGAWAFGTGEFYVGLWVYIDHANLNPPSQPNNALLSNRKGGTNHCWCLYISGITSTAGQLRLDTGASSIADSGTSVVASKTWTHVAMQRNAAGKVYLFLDGVQVYNVMMLQDMSDTAEDLHIGADQQAGFQHAFGGVIDELIIIKGPGGPSNDGSGFTPASTAYGVSAGWGPVNDNAAVDAIFAVATSVAGGATSAMCGAGTELRDGVCMPTAPSPSASPAAAQTWDQCSGTGVFSFQIPGIGATNAYCDDSEDGGDWPVNLFA